MRIAVTGGLGQLGHCLQNLLGTIDNNIQAEFFDIDDFDFTDRDAVEKALRSSHFDIIVNCAAYTAVDRAETEPEKAFAINVSAVDNIACVAKEAGIKVIHISTDYVFKGDSNTPYTEDSIPDPMTIYGKTKLQGEKVLLSQVPDAIIIRTAWLYSQYGKNFYLTMRGRALSGQPSQVVSDQYGSPTNANDLAMAIYTIINTDDWQPGIYHFTNAGECNWYEFAKEIYHISGADSSMVTPISSENFNAAAPRPKYSVLDSSRIQKTFRLTIPTWKESLNTLEGEA